MSDDQRNTVSGLGSLRAELERISPGITKSPLQHEVERLRADLAWALGECIEFAMSYGGDEERYRARYRELTGHGYDEEPTP